MRICLSIFAEDFLKDIDKIISVSKIFDRIFIEIRLDNIYEPFNFKLLESLRERLILTIRRRGEEVYREGEKEYHAYLKLISFKPSYVDIDSRSRIFHRVAETAYRNNVRVIASYHNFDETPSLQELEHILFNITSTGEADIVKIVTYANEYEDNLVIFNLLNKYVHSHSLIAFCMGEKGILSRIASPLFGSYLTYVSLNDKATAPGQFSLNDLLKFMEVLL